MKKPLDRKVHATLEELKQARDEVKLELHLATMEGKERWERELEPELRRLEARAEQVAGKALDAALAQVREFRARLHARPRM